MGTEADPKRTFEYTPRRFRAMPAEQRPVWEFRYLTIRQWREFCQVCDDHKGLAAMTGGEAVAALWTALAMVVAGWRNVADEAGPITGELGSTPGIRERLEGALELRDLWELYFAARVQQELTVSDEKN